MSTERTTAYVSADARQALLDDWFRDYLPILLAGSGDDEVTENTPDSDAVEEFNADRSYIN